MVRRWHMLLMVAVAATHPALPPRGRGQRLCWALVLSNWSLFIRFTWHLCSIRLQFDRCGTTLALRRAHQVGRYFLAGTTTMAASSVQGFDQWPSHAVVDISLEMLGKAREKVSAMAAAASKVSLERGDVQALDYATASFDCTIDTFSLCVYQEPLAALREMRRVTKPGPAPHPISPCWQAVVRGCSRSPGCGLSLGRRWPALFRHMWHVCACRGTSPDAGAHQESECAAGMVCCVRQLRAEVVSALQCTSLRLSRVNAHRWF